MEQPAVMPSRIPDKERQMCHRLVLPWVPRRLVYPFLVIPAANLAI